jgi:cell wall-associated NlpC family hydrolase
VLQIRKGRRNFINIACGKIDLKTTHLCNNVRKILFIVAFCLIFIGCRKSSSSSSSSIEKYDTDALVFKAKKHIGTKYKLGGSEPKTGFDCSGFTRYMFDKFGVDLPQLAAQQADFGKSVLISEAKKGDLIFFKGGDAKSKVVGHVGVIITNKGEQPIKFIHASSSKGIMVSGLDEKYFRERFVRIRRVK